VKEGGRTRLRESRRAASATGGFIIALLVAAVLCAMMIPTVTQNLTSSQLNITGAPASVVDTLPTIFAIMIIVILVVGMLAVFR